MLSDQFFSDECLYPNLEFTVQVFGDITVARVQVETFLEDVRSRFISAYEFKQLMPKPPAKHYEDESYLVSISINSTTIGVTITIIALFI